MFTGIIREVGKITSVQPNNTSTTFTVECQNALKNKEIGESIAVNGACVTVISKSEQSFTFDAIEETLRLTNLGELREGELVNLEPAATLNQALDGHIVQGHVDTQGTISSLEKVDDKTTLTLSYPKEIRKYLALKGSVTINGVSLTVSHLTDDELAVELIPHTLEQTNLGNLTKGAKVNLEIDILARYLESLLNAKEQETKYHFLKDRGFI